VLMYSVHRIYFFVRIFAIEDITISTPLIFFLTRPTVSITRNVISPQFSLEFTDATVSSC
jgi:hypothetical protein